MAISASETPVVSHIRLAATQPYGDMLVSSDYCIAVSDFVAQQLRSGGVPESQIQRIYDGVEVPAAGRDFDVTTIKAAYGINADKRVILTVGRLEPNKRQDLALRAFRLVHRALVDSHLVFVGDIQSQWAYAGSLRAATRDYGLDEHVSFLPYQPEMQALYKSAALALHCGKHEALGMAVLETMAEALPIVAVKSGALPELIHDQHSGLLCDENEEAISSAIVTLLKEPALALKLGCQARQRAGDDFSATRSASRLLDLYAECAR